MVVHKQLEPLTSRKTLQRGFWEGSVGHVRVRKHTMDQNLRRTLTVKRNVRIFSSGKRKRMHLNA